MPPIGEGKVESAATSAKPSGWLWDQLAKAKTSAQVKKVEDQAIALGYDANGQLRQAISKRLKEE